MTLKYEKEKYEILDRLIAGETVRQIKNAMKIGAEKIQKVREAHPKEMPKKHINIIKTRTRARTRTLIKEQEQEQKFIQALDQSRMTQTNIYFTEREKKLAIKMFRAVIRQRAIKITEEDEYQNLIDKITGD